MDDIKNRIEAILFTTGNFMDVEEIAKLCNLGSTGIVKDAITELINDYKLRDCSLEIAEEGGKYKLSIRKAYVYLTAKLLNDTELDRPTQETLAIIAYKQPIMQCDLVKIRGNKSYDHVHTLKERELVTSEKSGRTRILKVTPKFYDYFDTAMDTLKQQFEEIQSTVGTVEDMTAKEEVKEAAQEPVKGDATEEAPKEAVEEAPKEEAKAEGEAAPEDSVEKKEEEGSAEKSEAADNQ